MRTQEQIIADCEKRFEELRAEKERRDNDPRIQYPCASCRWYREGVGEDGHKWHVPEYRKKYATCHEPLVKGFSPRGRYVWREPSPCGPERALWQPKQTRCERILQFFFGDE